MSSTLKSLIVSILLTLTFLTNVNAVDTTQQTAFIERFYQNILDRTADTEGMNTWLDVIQNESATKVAMGFLNSQEFINKNLSNEEFVDILYQTMFDRQSDLDGRNTWLQKMNDGRSKQSVMFGFFNSQEFKNLTDSFGVTQILPADKPSYQGVESYVNRFYNLVLKREPDDAGFDDWVKQLTNKTKDPTEIANGFLFSQEYQNQNEDNSTFLDTCYKAFFGRDADVGGKTDWLNKLNNQNYTKEQIFEGFTGSQEFDNLVDSFNLDNLDNDAPVIISESSFSVNENQISAFTIIATDDSTITYSISGIDSTSFNIDSTTGVVTFKTNPDYETKTSYSLTVRATDTSNNVSTQDVIVKVLDVVEDTNINSTITFKNFDYEIITSPITGKKWLDRNLGASQVCTSSTNEACYGDYYQWGRLADGHENVNSATTTTLATNISNVGSSSFITNSSSPYDWTTADSIGLDRFTQWSKTDGTGVCPVGFRVPTIVELLNETVDYMGIDNSEIGAVKVIDSDSAFQNFLKLPSQFTRSNLTGLIDESNLSGNLWSNTYNSNLSNYLYFDNSTSLSLRDARSNAKSIRCIKDIDTTKPVFKTPSTISVREYTQDVLTVNATDNSPVTYTLTGVDVDSFSLSQTTGQLFFNTQPEYAIQSSYSIIIIATDTSNNKTIQNLTVTILKSFESGDTWGGRTYNIVTSPITSRKWLDRNLGASSACASSKDSSCYGDYYSLTYYSSTSICPVGFRIPTKDELIIETTGYTGIDNVSVGAVQVTNAATAFKNFLKIPLAGLYDTSFFTGLHSAGEEGALLTSFTQEINRFSNILYIGEGVWGFDRGLDVSIRCIESN